MTHIVLSRRMASLSLRYLVTAIIVAGCGAVYELFSHGVYSYWMLYAFAPPLVLGALPFLLLARSSKDEPPAHLRFFWHAGIATLTVGFFIEGVLAIYGTTNALTVVYFAVSLPMLLGSLILWLIRKPATDAEQA